MPGPLVGSVTVSSSLPPGRMRRGMQSTSCGNESAAFLKPHVDDDDIYGHGDKCTGVVVVTTPGPFVCSHTRRMTPMERNYVSVRKLVVFTLK